MTSLASGLDQKGRRGGKGKKKGGRRGREGGRGREGSRGEGGEEGGKGVLSESVFSLLEKEVTSGESLLLGDLEVTV